MLVLQFDHLTHNHRAEYQQYEGTAEHELAHMRCVERAHVRGPDDDQEGPEYHRQGDEDVSGQPALCTQRVHLAPKVSALPDSAHSGRQYLGKVAADPPLNAN